MGIVLGALLAALLLGSFARVGTQTADAEVSDTIAIGCEFLIDGIDGDTEDIATAPTGADGVAACNGITAADVDALAGDLDGDGTANEAGENGIGDSDGVLEASDFEDLDLDLNQVTDEGSAGVADSLYIFAFVDDDALVEFDAEDGATIVINEDGGVDEAAPAADANVETCTGGDDEDCGTTTTSNGDGVVVATFSETTNGDGDTNTVSVRQEGTEVDSSEEVFIEGAADEIVLTTLETVMNRSEDDAACTEDADVTDATDQLADLDKTVVIADVEDNDGDELTRIPVVFTVEGALEIDESEAGVEDTEPSFDSAITVEGGSAGVGAFAVICSDEASGEGTVTATINDGTAGEEDASVDITVVGPPAAVALTVSPAIIACDGTASSTVTATVTDEEGNNVANGTNVNFSVVALGTTNPINAGTIDGVATSQVTPLSGTIAGVTVIVTAGEGSETAQASIRVDCNIPAVIATAIATASITPGTGIGGPDTGSGGYTGQDSAGFPTWILVALALGSVALVGGGLVTRRVSK
jgi:hypothetical protein